MDAGTVSHTRATALAIALMLPLAACAPAQGPAAENRSETIATGAAVGCVVGGILGAAAVALTWDAGTAELGCAAGAALGAGLGYLVARANEQDAIAERQIRERTELAREVARVYDEQSQATMREIALLQQEIDRTNIALRRGRISRRAHAERIAPLSARAAELMQRADATNVTVQRHEAAAAAVRARGSNIDGFDRALGDIRATNDRERAALESLRRSLVGRG